MSEPPAFTVNDNREDASTARIKMIHELHAALYGDSWARPETPREVWEACLAEVRRLTRQPI